MALTLPYAPSREPVLHERSHTQRLRHNLNNTVAAQLFPAPRAPAQQGCSPCRGRAGAQRAKRNATH
eukprot:5188115-Lingulodinium_polyedra.AAC.1